MGVHFQQVMQYRPTIGWPKKTIIFQIVYNINWPRNPPIQDIERLWGYMHILTSSILPLVISCGWVHKESDSARHVNADISTISTKLFRNRSNIPKISLVEKVDNR
jgi:hypothetical protein